MSTFMKPSQERAIREELQADIARYLHRANLELERIEECFVADAVTAERPSAEALELQASGLMHLARSLSIEAPRKEAVLCRAATDGAGTALDALAAAIRHGATHGRRRQPAVDWQAVQRLAWLEAKDAVRHAIALFAHWVRACRVQEVGRA